MNSKLIRRMRVEAQLRKALDTSDIYPHYQPKVCAASGDIVGYEALMQFNSDNPLGISTSEFITVAEESGLIVLIDQLILRDSVSQFGKVFNHIENKIPVSVNLSALNFFRGDLIEHVINLLQVSNTSPENLEFEITESSIMKNKPHAIRLIEKLNSHGIEFAIDDFGTGYSSLSYLREFPVNVLKIDISFIDDIESSITAKNLVSTIIDMSHSLGLKCVAEGVESIGQVRILRELKCDVLQGFYFSKSVDINTVERWANQGFKFDLENIRE